METSKQEFFKSLDLIDEELEKYIPIILEELWELGSMPDYIIELIKKNIQPFNLNNIVDFGCGKGAVLVKLAQHYNFNGLGIDIVPQFIESAEKYALKYDVADRIKFQTGDLKEYSEKIKDVDLLIYGYDCAILGNPKESLLKLIECIKPQGRIILEIAYTLETMSKIEGMPNESELIAQINETNLKVLDKIIWDSEEVKKVNSRNNELIVAKINQLIELYPDKEIIFKRYMNNQLEECKTIENDMVCSTWLLKKS